MMEFELHHIGSRWILTTLCKGLNKTEVNTKETAKPEYVLV